MENNSLEGMRAVLCSVYPSRDSAFAEMSLDELNELTETAGGTVAGIVTQIKDRPDTATVFGKGKCQELKAVCEYYEADVVIFDQELSPHQITLLQNILGDDLSVIDRSMLILSIFSSHAHSAEAIVQVRLAQLKYTAPRLTGKGKFMSRMGGSSSGSTGSRGPGETQLELDRRNIKKQISALEQQLKKIEDNRQVILSSRRHTGMKQCAIVGYTNAGKSTLLNYLTEADILTEDRLFATLDTTTRKLSLPDGSDVLISDTVGFIRNLPHHLIKSFRSTFDEAAECDLLIIVTDFSDPEFMYHIELSEQLLTEIDASDKDRLYVLNKCDRMPDNVLHKDFVSRVSERDYVYISALTGQGTDDLLEKIQDKLFSSYRRVTFSFPHDMGKVTGEMYASADNVKVDYDGGSVVITATVDDRLYNKYREYITVKDTGEE